MSAHVVRAGMSTASENSLWRKEPAESASVLWSAISDESEADSLATAPVAKSPPAALANEHPESPIRSNERRGRAQAKIDLPMIEWRRLLLTWIISFPLGTASVQQHVDPHTANFVSEG